MTDTTPDTTAGTAAAPVLVVLDHHDGVLRASALELLTAARVLGAPVHALWVGDLGDPALAVVGQYGAVAGHRVRDEGLALPPERGAALAQVADALGSAVVLLSSTFENKETAARLALATGAALMVDASALENEAGRLVVVQQAFAATWTLRAEPTTHRVVVALKPNAVPAEPVGGAVPPVTTHEVSAPPPSARLVERTERPASGRPDLGEAQVVVVGGRGTNGDFGPVEDLADALGGAVGATRVATDEGWIGRETQIGQTGVTVSPRLYIGAGVSGAVHHRGGMQASGTIVAVNNDPDSPIFEIADLGIVGDLFTVLPQAAAELRRLRG